MIEKLTPEQEDLMLVYDEKWMQIMYSTEPIDREKSSDAVKEAYLVIGEKEPEIICCHSPYEAVNLVLRCKSITQLYEEFGVNLVDRFTEKLYSKTLDSIMAQASSKLSSQLFREGWMRFSDIFQKLLESIFFYETFHYNEDYEFLDYIVWAELAARCDFCFSVLNCKYHRRRWQALKSLTTQCGWIFTYEKACIICDRPRILSFDSQHRLHAEAGPAIQFADGYSLYSYHGVTLPEKYGKIHPNEWQPQWLLEEENAELKRVLIQGIGYDRIARELAAVELDTWQEYTLLKIDTNVDVEPIYLLKMTCPSTGFIHALRVPPEIESAREAIKWVNWGVDCEEFQYRLEWHYSYDSAVETASCQTKSACADGFINKSSIALALKNTSDRNKTMKFTLDVENNPTGWPDHTQLPESDGTFVKNFQEHPQSILLTDSITPVLETIHTDGNYCIGQDSGIYWRLTDPVERGAEAPDWFYVPNVPPTLDGESRRSYVMWKEFVSPLIVLEFVSGNGAEERDRTPLLRSGQQETKPGKFWIYENVIHPAFYGIYEVTKASVEVYHLIEDRYQLVAANERGHYPIAPLGVELGIWQGRYQNVELPWLRWWDSQGNLLLSGAERADRAEDQLEQLRAQLRSAGIEPEL